MSQECGICFEPCYDTIHGCNHTFCSHCIEEWYLTSNNITCPTCRNPHPSGYQVLIELRCSQAFRVLSLIYVFLNMTHTSRVRFKRKGLHWHAGYNHSFEEAMQSFQERVTDIFQSISTAVHRHIRLTRKNSRILSHFCNPQSVVKCWEMRERGIGAFEFYKECMVLLKLGIESKWWKENWNFVIFHWGVCESNCFVSKDDRLYNGMVLSL